MHLNYVTSKQTRDNLCGKCDRCVSLFLQTTIILKNSRLRDVTPRSLLKTDHSFVGTYCLQLQDIYQHFEGTYCLCLPESGGSRDFVERLLNYNQVTWSHVPEDVLSGQRHQNLRSHVAKLPARIQTYLHPL